METPEVLKQKIGSAQDLQSVVRTMKSLAAVNIRHYEKAVEALAEYHRTVETGLHILLRSGGERSVAAKSAAKNLPAAVIIGSDMGMCGQLNERITSYALERLKVAGAEHPRAKVLVVGTRVAAYLEDAGQPIEERFLVPGGTSSIVPLVQDLLVKLQDLQSREQVDQVTVFYSRHGANAAYSPCADDLLPMDRQWLAKLEEWDWPSRALPTFTMDWDPLFSSLIRQHLFVGLYRAVAESLASENAARLMAMQGAERTIEDLLEELTSAYHRERQMSITSELLEIVAGFEALTANEQKTTSL